MDRGTVLVIDDERDLVELVRFNLEREGYRVLGAPDGEAGLTLALTRSPDLILLDRMMPGPDGIALCRRLRQESATAHVPVILLTAKASEEDRVQGLDAGADDYVTKPFSVKELVARVRARLRRAGADLPPVIRNGDLILSEDAGEATFGGRSLGLSTAEFRMLRFLAAVPGRVMFRRASPPGQLLLGSLARRQGLITREQQRDALAAQERDPSRKIGELLVDGFVISQRDLEKLLEVQGKSMEGILGRLIVARRLATEFQVGEALRLQGRMVEAGLAPVPRLGEILAKRGVLAREALAAALELQNFMLYRCPSCGSRIEIHPEPGREAVHCPQCREEVPRLFAKIAGALHRVLEEAADDQAVDIPEDVLAAGADPARQFGRYILVEVIGRGGAGVVYRAWQRDVNRVVALKRLMADASEEAVGRTPFGHAEAVKRFFSEARAISELDHPHIVPLYDYGIAEQAFYYTMPFIQGLSLDALLHGAPGERDDLPGRLLPRKMALTLVRDMARALDYAHDVGVCHRDVKPGNILVDSVGKAWLIDFGLAKVMRLGDPAYEKGVIAGTPYYMPPEQATGDMEQVDARSDIYSLGAVLYELLSGFYPFAGMSSDVVFDVLPARPPDPPEKFAPDLPQELRRIVSRAMARSKGDRYPRAGMMADELEGFLQRMG